MCLCAIQNFLFWYDCFIKCLRNGILPVECWKIPVTFNADHSGIVAIYVIQCERRES